MQRRTFVIDIDGTIIRMNARGSATYQWSEIEVLPHARPIFDQLAREEAFVVLLTGRRESCREHTERALRAYGIWWDVLVMGAGGGERLIVNDRSADGACRAGAVDIQTNEPWSLPPLMSD